MKNRKYRRVKALNSGSVLNTGKWASLHNDVPFCALWPHWILMGRIAAFRPIINWWATWWPMAATFIGGPLCGPFPTFNTLPEFSAFTLYLTLMFILTILSENMFLEYFLRFQLIYWQSKVNNYIFCWSKKNYLY